MAILINMEMPKSCDVCNFAVELNERELGTHLYCGFPGIGVYVDDCIFCVHKDCPLIEIPTPHGDLIDRDELLSQYGGPIWTAKTDYAEGLRDVVADIKYAAAVIEAEPPESCGDCNHYCTGQFFNNEEICMVTGDNAPYDISDCPLRKKEEGRE